MRVNDRECVDERIQHLVDRLLAPSTPPHSIDEGPFVAPIAEDVRAVVPGDHGKEPFKDVALLVLAVGPERVAMLGVALTDNHPE